MTRAAPSYTARTSGVVGFATTESKFCTTHSDASLGRAKFRRIVISVAVSVCGSETLTIYHLYSCGWSSSTRVTWRRRIHRLVRQHPPCGLKP